MSIHHERENTPSLISFLCCPNCTYILDISHTRRKKERERERERKKEIERERKEKRMKEGGKERKQEREKERKKGFSAAVFTPPSR